MKKFIILPLLLLSSLAFSQQILPTEIPADESDLLGQCEGFNTKKPWAYCLYKFKNSRSRDVLYLLHGAGGNAQQWIHNWKTIRYLWRQRNMDAPTVISVSFGPYWALAEKNSSSFSGLFGFYTQSVMPFLESKLPFHVRRRLLLGESMGGFNAFQLVTKAPKLFTKSAIVCPAILAIDQFSTDQEVSEFIQRTGAESWRVYWALRYYKAFYPDPTDWTQAQPQQLFHHLKDAPPIYLSCGRQDQWGFFEATQKIGEALVKMRHDSYWRPLEGLHCVRNYEEIVNFLSN